jgi:hypothetical protein
MDREALIHFIGGAVGGTAGTALTCPLEVIKTRLQSSKHGILPPPNGKPSTSQTNFPQKGGSTSKVTKSSGRKMFQAYPVMNYGRPINYPQLINLQKAFIHTTTPKPETQLRRPAVLGHFV